MYYKSSLRRLCHLRGRSFRERHPHIVLNMLVPKLEILFRQHLQDSLFFWLAGKDETVRAQAATSLGAHSLLSAQRLISAAVVFILMQPVIYSVPETILSV